ncbi:MAG: hypothetical protein P1P93_09395 [Gammaproteobacteria bacterium]|nr:hypothetical protein [Gammaproteobacteria bacterium]MDT8371744.1 hypothetical protein [Gammaproteobacteria bacterium]
MLKHFFIVVLLGLSFTAQAESSYSGDSLGKIYLEMRYLHELGVALHKQYDLTDREQIGLCKFETGHNATRARNLIGAVNRIDYPDKETLINAAWSTYSCASCKGDGAICDTIPEQLDKIQAVLETD